MSKISELENGINKFSGLAEELLNVGTFPPKWKEHQGWRHDSEQKDQVLFILAKLIAIASTLNACKILIEPGYWFQIAILSRSIHEAHLSIASILPPFKGDVTEWPNTKQKESLKAFYRETWANPEKPFEDTKKRPAIRNLSAAIGHIQDEQSILSKHDATQVSLQLMRVLSDFTHFAYPPIMEHYSPPSGFSASGYKNTRGSVHVTELGHMFVSSITYLYMATELLLKIYRGALDKAQTENAEQSHAKRILTKTKQLEELQIKILALLEKMENLFSSDNETVKNTLAKFK